MPACAPPAVGPSKTHMHVLSITVCMCGLHDCTQPIAEHACNTHAVCMTKHGRRLLLHDMHVASACILSDSSSHVLTLTVWVFATCGGMHLLRQAHRLVSRQSSTLCTVLAHIQTPGFRTSCSRLAGLTVQWLPDISVDGRAEPASIGLDARAAWGDSTAASITSSHSCKHVCSCTCISSCTQLQLVVDTVA